MARSKLSHAALARHLGLTPQSITALKKKGMPTHTVVAAVAWRAANLDPALTKKPHEPTAARESSGTTDPAFVAARLQRARAMAELAALKAGEQRGDLIRAADARRVLASAAIGCRQIFERAPGRWAHQLAGLPTSRAVHAVLETLCAEALAELHAALGAAEAKLPTEAAGKGK